jgi:hypothetical protein
MRASEPKLRFERAAGFILSNVGHRSPSTRRERRFGLPPDHHESIDQRVERLCAWLWKQRTPVGKTVRDVLEFVLWGFEPSDMERGWVAAE